MSQCALDILVNRVLVELPVVGSPDAKGRVSQEFPAEAELTDGVLPTLCNYAHHVGCGFFRRLKGVLSRRAIEKGRPNHMPGLLDRPDGDRVEHKHGAVSPLPERS